jgi:hypothetical protein
MKLLKITSTKTQLIFHVKNDNNDKKVLFADI